MKQENPKCTGCFLFSVCSPGLQPERVRANGTISKSGSFPPVREACRHSSCEEGLEDAWLAKHKAGKPYIVMNWAGDTSLSIRGRAFGYAEEKPTEKGELRIVDQQTGAIYSFQDGTYFPTGQFATMSDD